MSTEKPDFCPISAPRCRQSVIVERDVFALAAAPAHIKCPCGKSELSVEFMPQRVRLSVPCVYCGRDHLVSCPSHAFLRERALAFSCTGLRPGLLLCGGGGGGVRRHPPAWSRRWTSWTRPPTRRRSALPSWIPMVMEEILSELRDIAARGGVSCACGSKRRGPSG